MAKLFPRSRTGLPVSGRWVQVGPPLSASTPNNGVVFRTSPMAFRNPPGPVLASPFAASLARLYPSEVTVPPLFCSPGPTPAAFRMVLRRVTLAVPPLEVLCISPPAAEALFLRVQWVRLTVPEPPPETRFSIAPPVPEPPNVLGAWFALSVQLVRLAVAVAPGTVAL